MTNKEAAKLYKFQEKGYSIMMSTLLVDGFVVIHEFDGEYGYDDDRYGYLPLSEIQVSDVEVYRRVKGWSNSEI